MKNRLIFLSLWVLTLTSCNPPSLPDQIEKWDVYIITMKGPSSGNPFLDNTLSATFTREDQQIEVPGFYDGDGTYKVRFSPDQTGTWKYVTQSNVNELSGQTGTFECVKPSTQNHGPVTITNQYYLEYADGTPFYSIGTTAYQWTSVAQSIQDKTIATLTTSPFTKIRMCVFPKEYKYGNTTEPWAYPFKRTGDQHDFSQPNFEFFQNFDQRVMQLLARGIQADVILFHPYDKRWGYDEMGNEMNERYVRYMMARLSAYRNVWWSLANEWDVPDIKEAIDWEGIGNLLMQEDPHQRLRAIHNWYNSEDHFYDHTKPWITHVSTQTSQFYNAERWRGLYGKPILFDEMRYEGDVPSGWGNLSGEEMTSYFWQAAFSGGYPMHGETFQNQADTVTEVRWWAKGGELVGESPERIAFFKTLMDQVPFKDMKPVLYSPTNQPTEEPRIYYLINPEIKMAYVASEGVPVEFQLSNDTPYTYYLIDTWNMQVLEEKTVIQDHWLVTTPGPYTLMILSKQALKM